jgi:hypothetical protein
MRWDVPQRGNVWLIELLGSGVCYARDGGEDRWVRFTDPRAWCFETKADAELIIRTRYAASAGTAMGHSYCISYR